MLVPVDSPRGNGFQHSSFQAGPLPYSNDRHSSVLRIRCDSPQLSIVVTSRKSSISTLLGETLINHTVLVEVSMILIRRFLTCVGSDQSRDQEPDNSH